MLATPLTAPFGPHESILEPESAEPFAAKIWLCSSWPWFIRRKSGGTAKPPYFSHRRPRAACNRSTLGSTRFSDTTRACHVRFCASILRTMRVSMSHVLFALLALVLLAPGQELTSTAIPLRILVL